MSLVTWFLIAVAVAMFGTFAAALTAADREHTEPPSRPDLLDGIGNCGYQRDGLTCTLAPHAGFWHNDERAGTQYHSATFRGDGAA